MIYLLLLINLIFVIFIHKKDASQIWADNKQQSPNLGPQVESPKVNSKVLTQEHW